MAGSQRAATWVRLAARGGNGTSLVTAAEIATPKPASEREMTIGDAAAAVIVGTGTPIATLIASHSVTMDFVDHFRETGVALDYDCLALWLSVDLTSVLPSLFLISFSFFFFIFFFFFFSFF